jgi:hypothetical protein
MKDMARGIKFTKNRRSSKNIIDKNHINHYIIFED